MTYAMTLDNSWEIMSEDEMYDVNGGETVMIYFTPTTQRAIINAGVAGLAAAAGVIFGAWGWIIGAFSASFIITIVSERYNPHGNILFMPFYIPFRKNNIII